MSSDKISESTQLAHERTVLAFLRTVAIFAGLYILVKKNTKHIKLPQIILSLIILITLYRLYDIGDATHVSYIRALGLCLLVLLSSLVFY